MKRFCWFFAVLLAFSLSACGGGGGTTGSSPYTGITTAAVITEANADAIAMSVYEAGDVSSSLSLPLGPSTEGAAGSAAASGPRILFLVRTLQGVAEDFESRQGASGGGALRTVVTESGTFDDGFGGSFSYMLSADDQTGDFTGTFTFTNFHGDAGTWMSGSMTASGNFDMTAGTFNSLQFSFPSLTISDGVSTQTAMGSVDLLSVYPSSTATVNLFLSDSLTGKTVWIDHFTLDVTEGAGYTEVTESGTIYLPDYGFVVVSTAVPFNYAAGSATPSSGVLVITGGVIPGSWNCRVMLTAIDETTCAVDVDANGDGTYETTFTHPWI
jgi:hypothetical protein